MIAVRKNSLLSAASVLTMVKCVSALAWGRRLVGGDKVDLTLSLSCTKL